MNTIKIAIFPSGTEIGLEINNALRFSKDIELIGLSSIKDHTRYIYNNYFENLPFYNDKDFIEKLNEIVGVNGIDFIYPGHDDVLLYLTQNKDEINTEIITSDLKTVEICRSKIKTYKYFETENFIPKTYNDINEVNQYPVFIKPDIGQGSHGAKLIKNRDELKYEYNQSKRIVICEYLSGEEYTIDCFTDTNGDLKIIIPRIRRRVRCGISVNSEGIPLTDEVENIAKTINSKLRFNGAWFFQVKKDIDGNLKLLEIAPRIAGTMGLGRNTGVNFPLLTLYNTMNINTEIIKYNYNIEVDRAFVSRYKIDIEYKYVYIDLDDTIIFKGKINQFVIMYLYQLVNNGIKIILLTKHAGKIFDILMKYRICKELFDEIIHIEKNDEKFKYIKNNNAIFIDDSFSERLKIYKNLKIVTFDLNEIEALIDWRI